MKSSILHKAVLVFGLCLPVLILSLSSDALAEKKKLKTDSSQTRQAPSSKKSGAVIQKKSTVNAPVKKSLLEAALQSVLERFKEQPKNQITRGEVCPIAPGILEKDTKVLSDRPVFVWEGAIDTISLIDFNTDELLWRTAVPKNASSIQYSGKPLKPGNTYIWRMSRRNQIQGRYLFEVLSTAERSHLPLDVNLIRFTPEVVHSQDQNSLDQVIRALSQLSDQALWSDVLTLIHQTKLIPPPILLSGCSQQKVENPAF